MAKWKKASHTVYQCSYHLVWTPPIPVPDITGRNKRICREEDTDNMRLEASGNTGADDNARSYPHGGDNTAEAGDSGADGDIERENGDSRFPTTEKPSDKTILGESFLEPRLLCHDGRGG